MSTLVQDNAVERIEVLKQEADELAGKYREKFAEIAEIAKAVAEGIGSSSNGSVAKVESDGLPPLKKRGRPPGAKSKRTTSRADNETPLRAVIWEILSRDTKDLQKKLPQMSADAKGLKVSEIKQIIEDEGSWTSTSENINPQIQQHVYKLQKEKKLVRHNETHRYEIAKGATLD